MGIGREGWRVELKVKGWLGKVLSVTGYVRDVRPPISSREFQDMLDLYMTERKEQEEERRIVEAMGR